jgi:peptidoglycan/xylan/chitin deacetylase (PgdA/CDA1 family)
MLRNIKLIILKNFKSLGIYSIVSTSGWRRNRLLILCYHGISLDDEHNWSGLYVPSEHLRKRFLFMKENNYNILSLDEGLRLLYKGQLPPKSVAITFDDGFYDFSEKAVPLLKEFGFHATVYLTTYYCISRLPVFDPMIMYLLWKGEGQALDTDTLTTDRRKIFLEKGNVALRLSLVNQIIKYTVDKNLSADQKDKLARVLAERLSINYDRLVERRILSLMTPEEVRTLDSRLVSVQLHTHRHRAPTEKALFLRELHDNVRAITSLRPDDPPPNHFCYPSGAYDLKHLTWLKEEGVVSATTCDTKLVSRSSCPLLLPRLIDTMVKPELEFEGWLSGVSAFLPSPVSDRGRALFRARAVRRDHGDRAGDGHAL